MTERRNHRNAPLAEARTFQPEDGHLPNDDLPASTDTSAIRFIELLSTCEQFLRTASPTVRNELHVFLTAYGHHPISGLPAFLDELQITVHRHTPTR